MCLIALAWRVHPRYPLVVAANRDEFHERPTLPLAAWEGERGIVGGRDLLHGGGWIALRGRRMAAVTNVRHPQPIEGHSRGDLVADFARSDVDAHTALHKLAAAAEHYRPFNLLLHDGETLSFATNLSEVTAKASERRFATRTLSPGIHGVSNGALNAPWPKTETLMTALDRWLATSDSADTAGRTADPECLFAALVNTDLAPDAGLPDTGIGLERERFLSPAFITHAAYGTRASTVVLIADDHAEILERRFGPDGKRLGETRMRTAFDGREPVCVSEAS